RATSESERAFVLSIVRVIETIGLQTVAEGIETREQAEYLQAMGCDCGQGYYFAEPMEFSALDRLLGSDARFLFGESSLTDMDVDPIPAEPVPQMASKALKAL